MSPHELRSFDVIGRHGGEEFLALLSNITTTDALNTADRLRQRISELSHDNQTQLTVSIGVALYPADADNLDELFKLADTALYTAKEAGRNRIRLATDPAASARSVKLQPGT